MDSFWVTTEISHINQVFILSEDRGQIQHCLYFGIWNKGKKMVFKIVVITGVVNFYWQKSINYVILYLDHRILEVEGA